MNFSSLIGFILAIVVFVVSVATSTPISSLLANWHAALIVIGSTIAVAMICFPAKTLWDMVKIVFRRVLGKDGQRIETVISEIVAISQQVKANPAALNQASAQTKTPFLKEALDLVSQGGFQEVELDLILRKRAQTFMVRYDQQAHYFKTISKFPPSFGLLGTTLGMIGLMQALGSPDSFKLIGPAMATGLGATLLGIAISNFILMPIAENLIKLNKEDEVVRDIVIDGVKMLTKRQHPLLVEEYLRSYQLPQERQRRAA
jgi:chemotaxis protein MotA